MRNMNTIIKMNKNGIKSYTGNYDYFLWKDGENNKIIEKKVSSRETGNNKNSYKELKERRNKKRKIEKRMAVIDDELAEISMEQKNNITGSDFEKLQVWFESNRKQQLGKQQILLTVFVDYHHLAQI